MQYKMLILTTIIIALCTACGSNDDKAQELLEEGKTILKEKREWTAAGDKLLQSLQLQDESKPTKLLGETYINLSRVLWEQDFIEKAFDFAHKGLDVSMALSNDTLRIMMLTRLGSCHYMATHFDSAAYYYQRALEKSIQLGDSNCIQNAYNNLGAVLLSKEKPEEAIRFFNMSQCYETDRKMGNFHYYYNLSRCYQNMGDWGKCADAIRKTLAVMPKTDLEGHGKLYQRLFRALWHQGQYEDACNVADTSYKYTDRYWQKRRRDDLKDLTDQYQQERYETQLKLQRTQWIAVVVVVLVVMGLCIVVVGYRNKKRIIVLQQRLENLKLQIYRAQHAPATDGDDDGQDEPHPAPVDRDQLYQLYQQQFHVARDLFRTRPAYVRLCQLKYRTDRQYLSDAERMPLLDSLIETFVEPLQNLRQLFPELTEDECIYAILTFVGCSNATISILTKTSEATLRKRRSRFKQKSHESVFNYLMQGEEGA